MSFTNSAPFVGPFGCAVPGFVPNFSPAYAHGYSPHFAPNFNHNGIPHFAPAYGPHTANPDAPTSAFPSTPFFASFNNSPSPFGCNPTPWFSNPASYNSFGNSFGLTTPVTNPSWNPSWNNTFGASSPAAFGSFSPCNASNHFPNTWHAAPFASPAYGWNQHTSFSPFAPNFSSFASMSPWFTNPNFVEHSNASHVPATAPWFAPAFGGAPWLAPHNWANGPVNAAWSQPAAAAANGTHPNASPYAVATPPNTNASRDAA